MLDLLNNDLENVQVETDSNFDRALKAAVQKGGSDPSAVLDALIDELNITGGTVNFSISGLGNASAGRQSLNVVFQPGTNPNTAANNAASGWLGVLRGLAGSGEYSGLVSAVQVNGGYILAISVTVEQPGNIGSDDDDNEPAPDPGPGYTIDENGIYLVSSAKGLQYVAGLVNSGENRGKINITLTSDIDLSGISNWTPIGTYIWNDTSKAYTGKFDGNDCTITGLKISSSGDYVGLFGFIGKGGEVKNLTLKDADVSGNQFVGGMAGHNDGGTLTDCKVEGGSISGTNFVGGVVGCTNNNSTIINCHTTSSVIGNVDVGGVVGCNQYSTVIACYATGSISGGDQVGGVAGQNNGSTITACYAIGSISGGDQVGGVAGNNRESGAIKACYHATGNVSGSADVGGVVGGNGGTVAACYHAGGSVSGSTNVGGVAGTNSGDVGTCYWSGTVKEGDDEKENQGIGNGSGNATKVDGMVVTWDIGTSSAMNIMNVALKGKGWQYVGNGSGNPPLTLKQE